MIIQTASDVAMEIAAMIRARDSGHNVDQDTAADAVDRLLSSSARTASDALACLTMARMLFNLVVERDAPTADDLMVWNGALSLIRKASNALEAVTGERAATFAGHEWH